MNRKMNRKMKTRGAKITGKCLSVLLVVILFCNGMTLDVNAATNPYDGTYQYASHNPRVYTCTWYAWKRAYEVTGVECGKMSYKAVNWWNQAPNWGLERGDTPRPNSIAVYSGGPEGDGHVAFVSSVSDDRSQMYVEEAGVLGKPDGINHQATNATTVGSERGGRTLEGYIYLPTPDTQPPTIQNVRVTNVSRDGYTVMCDVTDDVGILKVQFPTWTDRDGQDDLIWADGTRQGHSDTFEFRVDKANHNNEYGLYLTHIYAHDTSGKSSNTAVSCTVEDLIVDVSVTDVSSEGYTVLCTVPDGARIDRVQFPTWTEKNWQDDIQPHWWDDVIFSSGWRQGNTFTFRVKRENHNNEYGLYNTHIYVIVDNVAHSTSSVTCTVPEPEPGVTVRGEITSYNPGEETTVELYAPEDTNRATPLYTATIDARSDGSGEMVQSYTLRNVPAGTYDLVIRKGSHAPYTITGVTVGSTALDLTESTNPAIARPSMFAGDITGDAHVNFEDLEELLHPNNYGNRTSETQVNPKTDLNGDELVNFADLEILIGVQNYGKDGADCTVAYTAA